MKKINLFGGFKTRLTAVLILSMFFTAALSNLLISQFTLRAQFNQLRDKLMIIAQTASLLIDPDVLMQVPLNKNGLNSHQYKSIAAQLKRIKTINPLIKYIYTMTKTEQEGIWQFVVDPEPTTERKPGVTSYPGDKYDASRFSELLKAFDEASADKKLEVDEWGITLSGYAPIRDKTGKAIAILGVDILADDVYQTRAKVEQRIVIVLVFGIILSILLGLLFSRRITRPIRKLLEGTRNIAKGNLDYRVDVQGRDEIAELAESFNNMAKSLDESRKKLQDYFYKVVQSLVRVLEARDHYTRGHSDRVAEYSYKLARKMGLSSEKAELLKEAAELHDIGKLGIPEEILNKKDKLTDEEWDLIKKHPEIGEDILKPVFLTEDLLAIVRGHHERFDGKGYPDKLTGENVDLFTQIIWTVDAYDAMTSPRAYRKALSKDVTIDELKKNSGSQFNPEVIDKFLQLLAEEEQ